MLRFRHAGQHARHGGRGWSRHSRVWVPVKVEFGGSTAWAAVAARCCCSSGSSLNISLAMRASCAGESTPGAMLSLPRNPTAQSVAFGETGNCSLVLMVLTTFTSSSRQWHRRSARPPSSRARSDKKPASVDLYHEAHRQTRLCSPGNPGWKRPTTPCFFSPTRSSSIFVV